uniref:Serpin domain-containing protein n=1 Tax=Romanomermis culicivorax TaxID=13658 RepID=A0A915HR37_ROMCU
MCNVNENKRNYQNNFRISILLYIADFRYGIGTILVFALSILSMAMVGCRCSPSLGVKEQYNQNGRDLPTTHQNTVHCWPKLKEVGKKVHLLKFGPGIKHMFAADFAKLLHKRNENFVFSPISLEMLFAMLWEGADGDTDKQIRKYIFHCEDYNYDCASVYVSSLCNLSMGYTTETATLKFAPVLAMDENIEVKFGFRQAFKSYPSAQYLKIFTLVQR